MAARQRRHSDQAYSDPARIAYEGNWHHDYFRAIPFERLAKLLRSMTIDLTGETVLLAGCGSGVDLHYLRKRHNARWFVADLSPNAVALTRQAFPDALGSAADLRRLPFADGSFDYVFVASSLHHLAEPLMGLYELLRVARRGVLVIEPNDSWLTRLATTCGVATEIEEAGNYVYRFARRDIEKVARALFARYDCRRFFACHTVAGSKAFFVLLKLVNGAMNVVAPALGNTIVFVLEKPGAEPVIGKSGGTGL